MFGKVMLSLGLTPTLTEFLPGVEIAHLIGRKYYDEKITTIHTCKSYYGVIIDQKSKQQQEQRQIQKNKKIKRILVVDDEYDINLTVKLILEENGFKVDSFTDAFEALENFRTGLYDLIMLDVKMPAMNGFILCEKIRKMDDNVTICFLTAADEVYYEVLKKRYANVDENYVIRKPVDNDSLVRRIKSMFYSHDIQNI
jgi:CheY-like chemotaxis protein